MIIGHVTPPGANLFADMGLEPVEAENLFVRSDLMHELLRMIRERRLKQREAAALFGVSQPRISDLKRGKIDSFTIDSLVNMLACAGIRVKVSVVDIATEPKTYEVTAREELDNGMIDAPAAAQA